MGSMEIDLSISVSPLRQELVDADPFETDVEPYEMPLAEMLATAIFLTTVTLVTVLGNIMVILSVFTYKPLRSAQNFFIVSLAVADLTVAVLVMPLNIVYGLVGRWVFGLFVCKLWLTCDVLCCTASILNLCAIALDRYWAIHDPVNYVHKRTWKRVLVMIVLVWVISGVICLPPLIGWNNWPHELGENTPCRHSGQQGYIVYSSSGSFFIPLIIMTAVYVRIYVATRRRLRERAAKASKLVAASNHQGGGAAACKYHSCSISSSDKVHETNCSNGLVTVKNGIDGHVGVTLMVPEMSKSSSVSVTASPLHQLVEEKHKISLSKERRAARVLGIIMGVFVVCWLPFFLMYVILPFCDSCSVSVRMENLITWMGYVNSTLNPIIYTIFNEDFRRAFVRLLRF